MGKSLWSVGIDTLKIRAQSVYITIGWVDLPAPDRHVWWRRLFRISLCALGQAVL